jgi:phosphotriesterase-related protein
MGSIQTVTGVVEADQLGLTLMHEHLFANLSIEYRGNGTLNDEAAMRQEVEAFRAAGGRTIVDVTPSEISHGAAGDPTVRLTEDGTPLPESYGEVASHTRPVSNIRALRRLADATGVHIVLGTGHYRDPYLDRQWFDRHSVSLIGELMVRDITEGFPGTDVRAGIIGEVGADKWYVSAAEERSLRAAAYASRRTGLAISTHTGRWPTGKHLLDVLLAEDVPPERVIIGHCDTVLVDGYCLEMARTGAYVQLDTLFECVKGGQIIESQVERRVQLVLSLLRHGYHDRVLLAHDAALRENMSGLGGTGLSFIPTVFFERLRKAGLDDAELDRLTTVNPARVLAGS